MITVAKFGGSSVANSTQFKKVKNIVTGNRDIKYVVTSACGKENKEDHKITDLLYLCDAHLKYGISYEDIFELIEQKILRHKKELQLSIDLEKEFKIIKDKMINGCSIDYLVSRGEYLTALCLAEFLDATFIDAKDVIAFKYTGEIDLEASQRLLQEHYINNKPVVIPGFYGALPNGTIKIMSRGGSDITGAVIANVVDADMYENWTDVSGFLVADPHIIKNPLHIPCINYNELREMSYMGANVLHDDAVFPVKSKNIPINVRNTNNPEDPGTIILNDCTEMDKKNPPRSITGITGKKNFTVITMTKNHSSTEVGFLRKILSIFENYRISIESVPITVDTFSIIVSSKAIEQSLYEIIAEIKSQLKPDDIHVEDHLALVAVVGRAMKKVPGQSGRLLSEFGRNKINIKVINQSSDELSIVVGVDDKDFEKAIHAIYTKFIMEEEQ